MYAAPHVRTQIDRRHLAQRRIDTAKSLHDPRSGETISQNAKATLGRDKQHLEEEKEIEVAKVAGLRNIDRFDADILREALRSSEHERDADEEAPDEYQQKPGCLLLSGSHLEHVLTAPFYGTGSTTSAIFACMEGVKETMYKQRCTSCCGGCRDGGI